MEGLFDKRTQWQIVICGLTALFVLSLLTANVVMTRAANDALEQKIEAGR